MSKFLSVSLIAASLLLTSNYPTLAGTCASRCGPPPLQVKPGQYIRIQVVNKTYRTLKIEDAQARKQISLVSGQELYFDREGVTEPNLSILFWDEEGRSLQGVVSKPNPWILRLEIRPNNRYPSDRSLYILNDGRVNVF
ncbi:MAG TPA: hypothetical protein VK184_16800 [Nostocaceae cyanobacterium]|nr:hypothetical protein [Nostocaceae cyanobacterium]